jgi:MarR family transcriptional regulator, temperature-dependent positive regulator of motility
MPSACGWLGSDLELRVQSLNGSPVSEDAQYRLLKLIEANPRISQRELARTMGVSLGKANYCMKALVARGFVKLENFRRHGKKMAYAYLLTPAGLEEKARITLAFLRRKEQEYEAIQQEIVRLRQEVELTMHSVVSRIL